MGHRGVDDRLRGLIERLHQDGVDQQVVAVHETLFCIVHRVRVAGAGWTGVIPFRTAGDPIGDPRLSPAVRPPRDAAGYSRPVGEPDGAT